MSNPTLSIDAMRLARHTYDEAAREAVRHDTGSTIVITIHGEHPTVNSFELTQALADLDENPNYAGKVRYTQMLLGGEKVEFKRL